MKTAIFVFFVFFSSLTYGASGKICFGKNYSKIAGEHGNSVYLKIDKSDEIYFNVNYAGPATAGLDLNLEHNIEIYYEGMLVKSWQLNFSKLGQNQVVIWRSAGSWRMKPVDVGECE